MDGICENDLFGRFYIRKQHYNRRIQYYQSLDIVKDLLMDEKFNDLVTGWYIHNANGVRLSYFIDKEDNPDDIISFCENWFLTKGLDTYKKLEYPHQIKLVLPYADKDMEEEFRNYLFLSTLISLDLLEKNIRRDTRIFFGLLRKNFISADIFKHVLTTYFDFYSETYGYLTLLEKKEFINQLIRHYRNRTSWFHLMMNTIFSCDINDKEIWKEALKEIGL